MPGPCTVCGNPTCSRIQKREEHHEFCCPRCRYQCKLEAFVGEEDEEEEPSDTEEDSDDVIERQYNRMWPNETEEGTHQLILLASADFLGIECTWQQTEEEIGIIFYSWRGHEPRT